MGLPQGCRVAGLQGSRAVGSTTLLGLLVGRDSVLSSSTSVGRDSIPASGTLVGRDSIPPSSTSVGRESIPPSSSSVSLALTSLALPLALPEGYVGGSAALVVLAWL